MTVTRLQFHLDWKITLLTALVLPVLVSLGFWQLGRAEEKQEVAAEYQQRLLAPPTRVTGQEHTVARYQRIQARGIYLNERSFLLDNRLRNGRFGYEVVTPLQLAGGGLLLVNRGWIEGDPGRRYLPSIAEVAGEVNLTGYAYTPEPLPTAAMADSGERWPLTAQWVDFDAFAGVLGQALQPYVLRLDAGNRGALQTDWPLVNLRPEQHIGYAVQWFAMAAALLIAWIVLSTNLRAWWRARRGDR